MWPVAGCISPSWAADGPRGSRLVAPEPFRGRPGAIRELSGTIAWAEGTPKGGAEKFVLRFPKPVLAAFLWSIPYLEHLAEEAETQVTETYLRACWLSSFPNLNQPVGPSSIALLRLTVMTQGEAQSVVETFHGLPPDFR